MTSRVAIWEHTKQSQECLSSSGHGNDKNLCFFIYEDYFFGILYNMLSPLMDKIEAN